MKSFLLIAAAVMSVISFLVYAYDKAQARRGGYRVPERILLLLAFLFGATGAFIAMFTLRHKTLKKKFTLPVPLFMIIQIVVLVLV